MLFISAMAGAGLDPIFLAPALLAGLLTRRPWVMAAWAGGLALIHLAAIGVLAGLGEARGAMIGAAAFVATLLTVALVWTVRRAIPWRQRA